MQSLHAITEPEPQEMDLLVAFFDLTGFLRYSRSHSDRETVEVLSGYFELVGDIIEEPGGTVVKFIGDAGLIVFPEELVNEGVQALIHLKHTGDAWLQDHYKTGHAVIKAHFGPAICTRIGTRTHKEFDVFGMTVNTAAILPSHGMALTPQVFRKLDASTRKLFKKHTPPVTYIPVDEPHRD